LARSDRAGGVGPRRALRISIAVAAGLIVVVAAAFLVWTRVARYDAFPEAVAAAGERNPDGWYVFEPAEPAGVGFAFYPGALVDPAAYAPLMAALAERGVLAVIVPMPLDLAFLGVGRAADVIAAFPGVRAWAVGGHSLGGAMAAEFARANPSAVAALALLASYPAESADLSGLPLSVVSLYGSRDGLPPETFESSLARLPPDARLVRIEGGNHAQFGYYGPQKGDGVPTASREAQQAVTLDAIADLVLSMHR